MLRTISQKMYALGGVMALALGILSVFSVIANNALHDRDDARLVEISYLQGRQSDLDFTSYKTIKFARRVDTAMITCDSILKLHASELSARRLDTALKNYHRTFRRIVAASQEVGLTDSTGMQGELMANLAAIKTEADRYNLPEAQLALMVARSLVKEFVQTVTITDKRNPLSDALLAVSAVRTSIARIPDKAEQERLLGLLSVQQSAFLALAGRKAALRDAYAQFRLDIIALRPVMRAMAKEKEQRANIVIGVSAAVVIIAVIASFIVAVLLGRSITRSILSLRKVVMKIADGKRSEALEIRSQDELGELAKAFNLMLANLQRSVQDVQAEKASVQAKVELAVRQSEAEKRYLGESVETMLTSVHAFAEGDLTRRLQRRSLAAANGVHALDSGNSDDKSADKSDDKSDDISRLFHGFDSAVENIRTMVQQLSSAVEATSRASADISAQTSNVTGGIQQQARQSADVVEAIAYISASTSATTKQITLASDEAEQASSDASIGGMVVQQALERMNAIADNVASSALTIGELKNSSELIGEVIKVIEEIADQTNLLALNAAIEAARAGEAGRGFAVVADEVRKLAERTQQATKQITSTITQIQTKTDAAMRAMDSGTEAVQRGKAMNQQVGEALERIITRTERVSTLVRAVADASEQQATARAGIVASVDSMNAVAQASSEAVQQIDDAAANLHEMTATLEQLVRRFQVD
jgi:methyl-accepting chemotaxis protein